MYSLQLKCALVSALNPWPCAMDNVHEINRNASRPPPQLPHWDEGGPPSVCFVHSASDMAFKPIARALRAEHHASQLRESTITVM